jgi:predicted dehydrogenase
MTQKEIRVGIVGASATKSGAKVSHVPAINGLPGLKLAAVATSNEQGAREAAQAFAADRWFSDPLRMIRDPALRRAAQLISSRKDWTGIKRENCLD